MKKAVETKLIGYANVIKASLPYLNDKSSIINVASVHAHGTKEGYAMYAAANGGVISLTKALTVELRHHSRINTITPGGFITDIYKKVVPNWEEKLEKGQVLETKKVSDVVHFFLSEESSGINGAEILVEVGSSAMRAKSSDW